MVLFIQLDCAVVKIAKKVPFAVRNLPIESAKWFFLYSWTVLLSKSLKRYLLRLETFLSKVQNGSFYTVGLCCCQNR